MKKDSNNKKLRYLSHREFDRLNSISKNNRDDLILSMLYETGCTVNELVNIKNSHFNFEKNILSIRGKHARNKEHRNVFISSVLIKKIKEFQKSNTISDYLLFTRQSGSMTTKRICQLVKKYCKLAGLTEFTPQILRYTHIVYAYEKNIPLDSIRKQVGLKRSRAIELFSQLPKKESPDAYRNFMG